MTLIERYKEKYAKCRERESTKDNKEDKRPREKTDPKEITPQVPKKYGKLNYTIPQKGHKALTRSPTIVALVVRIVGEAKRDVVSSKTHFTTKVYNINRHNNCSKERILQYTSFR